MAGQKAGRRLGDAADPARKRSGGGATSRGAPARGPTMDRRERRPPQIDGLLGLQGGARWCAGTARAAAQAHDSSGRDRRGCGALARNL